MKFSNEAVLGYVFCMKAGDERGVGGAAAAAATDSPVRKKAKAARPQAVVDALSLWQRHADDPEMDKLWKDQFEHLIKVVEGMEEVEAEGTVLKFLPFLSGECPRGEINFAGPTTVNSVAEMKGCASFKTLLAFSAWFAKRHCGIDFYNHRLSFLGGNPRVTCIKGGYNADYCDPPKKAEGVFYVDNIVIPLAKVCAAKKIHMLFLNVGGTKCTAVHSRLTEMLRENEELEKWVTPIYDGYHMATFNAQYGLSWKGNLTAQVVAVSELVEETVSPALHDFMTKAGINVSSEPSFFEHLRDDSSITFVQDVDSIPLEDIKEHLWESKYLEAFRANVEALDSVLEKREEEKVTETEDGKLVLLPAPRDEKHEDYDEEWKDVDGIYRHLFFGESMRRYKMKYIEEKHANIETDKEKIDAARFAVTSKKQERLVTSGHADTPAWLKNHE